MKTATAGLIVALWSMAVIMAFQPLWAPYFLWLNISMFVWLVIGTLRLSKQADSRLFTKLYAASISLIASCVFQYVGLWGMLHERTAATGTAEFSPFPMAILSVIYFTSSQIFSAEER